MNTHKLIYLAGYFDGDGCFRMNITTQKSGIVVYERSMTITSIKKEPISFFKKNFRGFIGEKEAFENKKKAYTWTIKGDFSRLIAKKVSPFLVNKSDECSIFIEYCENIKPNKFKVASIEILNKRNNLILKQRKEIHENGLVTKNSILDLKQHKKSINPTKEDFIYLAGLIDAEGCFRISSRHRYRKNRKEKIYNTVLEIGNTKIKMLEWLIKRFGGNLTYVFPRSKNKRESATWAIHAKSLYPILINVHPFLINKKDVCCELIKFQKTILPNGGDRHSSAFKADIIERFLIREKIIEVVHKLNHKGNS